jgi:photosystem II stability/assembly factor-like uncharacterized protein
MRSLPAGLIVSLAIAVGLAPYAHASEPWQSQGPAGSAFHSLAEAPDGSIYAGTGAGLFRYEGSIDRWSPVPIDRERVGRVFASSGGVLFAEIYSGGCISWYEHFVSFDRGETWSEDQSLPYWVGITTFAETADGAIWASTSAGELFRRDPGSASWTQHVPVPSMGVVQDLVVTSDGALLVLATHSDTGERAVFLSDDNGATWSIPLRAEARLIVLATNENGYVVAGGWETTPTTPRRVTFYASTNSGRDWFERPCRADACAALNSVERLAILPNRTVAAAGWSWTPASGQLVVSDLFMEDWTLAARYSETPSDLLTDREDALWVVGLGHAQRSTDNAVTFVPASGGLVDTAVTSLVESNGRILATVGSYRIGGYLGFTTIPGSAGVQVSTDGGSTWGPTAVWQAYAVTASRQSGILATTARGVLRSVDHGDSWHSIPGTEEMAAPAVAESSSGALCVIATGELHCRIDSGADWFDAIPHSNTDALTVTPNDVFLVERLGTVLRSADGGHTWDETPLAENVSGFFIDPDGAVHAPIVDSDRIAVSRDSGRTWSLIHAPFPNPRSIAFHPVRGMFVGYSSVIYSSDDAGAHWNRIDLPAIPVALQVNGDRLIAGSERDGVWLVDLPPSVRNSSGRVGQ